MRKILIMFVILGIVAGCDHPIFDNGIKKAVREGLKDPDSAKFSDAATYGNHACISYNAKNGFGGYTGYKVAILTKISAEKYFVDSRDFDQSCTTEVLKKVVDEESALAIQNAAVLNQVMSVVIKAKLAPVGAKRLDEIPDPKCRAFADDTNIHGQMSVDKKYSDNATWKNRFDLGLVALGVGRCPDLPVIEQMEAKIQQANKLLAQ